MESLKILAAFAAGIGCGLVVSNLYFKERYKSISEEEIESMKEYYSKKSEKIVNERTKKDDMKNYNKKVSNYISSVPPSEIVNNLEKTEHPRDDEPEEPYQITSMEYLSEEAYFDKVSLVYYVEDEVLVGPGEFSDEDILDIGSTVGQDQIEILINGFDDGSALYVRNPGNGTDYEVTKSYASYKGMMLDD